MFGEEVVAADLQAAAGPFLASAVQAGGGGNGGRMRTARRARPLDFGRYAPYAQGAHDRRDGLRIPGILAGARIGTGRQE